MSEILRLNPFVRIDDQFDIVNVVDSELFDVTSLRLIPFFDYMTAWRSPTDARRQLRKLLGVSAERADAMMDDFVDANLLVRPGSTYDTLFEQSREWVNAGRREELDYYLTVTDSMEGKGSSSGRMWIKRAWEGEEIPDNYKTYDDAETIALEEPDAFETIGRDGDGLLPPSPDSPSDSEFTRRQLSELLYLAFGEMETKPVPGITEFIKKTSPSGGARHPTEAYVAVRQVSDVAPGIYHYSVKDHALELVSDADPALLADYVPSAGAEDAKLLLFCGSRIERNMMKYKFPRCYTVVTQDVGHLLQTFRLLSARMGRACRPIFNVDPAIHDAFEFSCYEEPILGGAMVR